MCGDHHASVARPVTTLRRVATTTHSALPDERNASVAVYINGEFVPRDQARISVFDSGFLVGDGIWEGIRLHHGAFAFLDRHLDRLFHGLKAASIDSGMTRDDVATLLHSVVERNEMTDGVHVRLMITRGDKKTPSQHPANLVGGPNIVVIAEWKQADPSVRDRGIILATSTVRRPPPDTLDQQLNTHSKLHEVIALVEAMEAGADEALMLDTNGHVATCNATNFFMVTNGQVWTSAGRSNLPGITRAVVLEEARAAGIPADERDFTLADVYRADEAFVTGTFGGLTPVVSVDGRAIGDGLPGPMTARLRDLYDRRVEREIAN
jgi:branched-chain amino acid aminotransferase